MGESLALSNDEQIAVFCLEPGISVPVVFADLQGLLESVIRLFFFPLKFGDFEDDVCA